MKLEDDILRELKPYENAKRAEHDISYVKSRFRSTGACMPAVRAVGSRMIEVLEAELSHADMRRELSRLFKKTTSHEVMTICLYYFIHRAAHLTLQDWKVLKSWSSRIDNWAHSDYISSIYTVLLNKHPNNIYPTIKTWNTSSNPWLRRLSLTSLLFYSRVHEKPLPRNKIFPLVKARLHDNDAYVQKAVGWQLRECGNVWPKETKAFVKKHATALSSIAFSYATEKWTTQEKKPIKHVRKIHRKRS